jgi:hypothetical protein
VSICESIPRIAPLLGAFAILALFSDRARADEPTAAQQTLAQQLFDEGRTLLEAGKTAEACPKFEAAAQYAHTPGVRLNLADCWVLLGKTASAWAMYGEALSAAERTNDRTAAELARKGRAALKSQLSYLTVSVPDDVKVPGLELLRDGENLPKAAWGAAVPVDPGEHEIVARAPGYKPWSTKKNISAAGANESIEVPELDTVDATSPVHRQPKGDDVRADPGQSQRTIGLIAGGVGIVGVGVGTFFGIRTIVKKNEYERDSTPSGDCLSNECATASHDAHTAGVISTIAFVAGGAFLATGAVLWFTAPKAKRASALLYPVASSRSAGLAVHATF